MMFNVKLVEARSNICTDADIWEKKKEHQSLLLHTNSQASFWTFAFLFHDLTKEPRRFLGTASVNGESETSVAIVVYHLNNATVF